MIKELYKQEIEKIPIDDLSLIEYLKESLKDTKKLCNGWDYLKTHLTQELKTILLSDRYNEITYNNENVEFIIKEFKPPIEDSLKKQLGSFVYIWKDIKRERDKKQEEIELKEKLLSDGFKEVEFLKYLDNETDEEFKKRCENYYKKLDGLKVVCVFDKDKIGIMGSFTKKEEHEGKLIYNDNICFLPKGHSKTGQILTNKFYYKEGKK